MNTNYIAIVLAKKKYSLLLFCRMETLFAEKAHAENEISSLRQLIEELQTQTLERDSQISEHQTKVVQMQEGMDDFAKRVAEQVFRQQYPYYL